MHDDDLQVFFDATQEARHAAVLRVNEMAKAMVERAGIELPLMYRLGYDNANCIGCVKGGEGYWRAIREDFTDQFEAMCLLQDEIGPGSWFLRYRSGPRKGERFPLRPHERAREAGACGQAGKRDGGLRELGSAADGAAAEDE
jgi:hypothetical protein